MHLEVVKGGLVQSPGQGAGLPSGGGQQRAVGSSAQGCDSGVLRTGAQQAGAFRVCTSLQRVAATRACNGHRAPGDSIRCGADFGLEDPDTQAIDDPAHEAQQARVVSDLVGTGSASEGELSILAVRRQSMAWQGESTV